MKINNWRSSQYFELMFFLNSTNYFVAVYFASKIALDRQINLKTSYFGLKFGFKKF